MFLAQCLIPRTQDAHTRTPAWITDTATPYTVAAILDETLSAEVPLFDLAAGMPLLREEQRGRLEGDR
ncbi:MAG: hypothetical protein WCH04_21255 [Gammaproteobacteria bacterium]